MWVRGTSRISEADATRFRQRRRELGLGPLVIHDSYLINLASPNPVLRTRSVQEFHQELVRAMALGADYLVAHPGSGRDSQKSAAISAIAQSLRQATRGLKVGASGLRILLENTAGQELRRLGSRFEELRDIVHACPDLDLGVCVDTAHLFAAGFDIRTPESLERTLQTIERTVGLDRVAVVHVNDSKTHLGSRADRHEHIGQGKIGLDAFRAILNHPLPRAGRSFSKRLLTGPVTTAETWQLCGSWWKGSDRGSSPRNETPAEEAKQEQSKTAQEAVQEKTEKIAGDCRHCAQEFVMNRKAARRRHKGHREATNTIRSASKPKMAENLGGTGRLQTPWTANRPFSAAYCFLQLPPYPSGTMHMGHMRNYTIGDAVARYKRMCGFNVLHPMGWDAFGLPAENAAIKNGIPPREWTLQNIEEFRRVLHRFGFSYDWRREISSCEPGYYRWNQWFFLRMLEKGIAYRKKSKVNWCPQCQTVLANEQVIDGYCWRHETTLVELKELEQWFLRITQYSDQLLDDMKQLEGGWPERVLTMQRNWIGKSQGARVRFAVAQMENAYLEVFTTRIDTIYGASAVVLSPAHPIIESLIQGMPGNAGMETRLKAMRGKSMRAADIATAEKEGFFIGRFVMNPFSGEQLPIWVANFVLAEYGTGALMCVPAHDERDYEFAEKYHLPVKITVHPVDAAPLRADRMKVRLFNELRRARGLRRRIRE